MRNFSAPPSAAPRALRPRTATGFRILLTLSLLTLTLTSPSIAQLHQGQKLVEATLVADTTAIVPGQPFRLGLHLRMAPGWHTYWENPGDSGLATTFEPDLPAGFEIAPITWPLPKRIIEPGNIQVYAYKDEVLLVRTITPPATLDTAEISLNAKSTWLVCEAICIPGKADVQLTLPVAPSAATRQHGTLHPVRRRYPLAERAALRRLLDPHPHRLEPRPPRHHRRHPRRLLPLRE